MWLSSFVMTKQGRLQQMNFEGAEYKPCSLRFLHHPSRLRCCLRFLDSVYASSRRHTARSLPPHGEGSRFTVSPPRMRIITCTILGGQGPSRRRLEGRSPLCPPSSAAPAKTPCSSYTTYFKWIEGFLEWLLLAMQKSF